ncbi:hypothetical protein LEP1GSC071_2921 [Leptospira santarosai str. JET]|nr:hypothetical protein LEP1GSC071_2921 [Leptospira santarosai str. JET]EMO84841.1 hypothetical protein LEP1GSC070_2168 [Leptospira santarosai str. AIM]EPG82403.1 hypothetical protein LEP1GSC048_3581 [Leptospira santarosai serovar Shermani str. 1342KT]
MDRGKVGIHCLSGKRILSFSGFEFERGSLRLFQVGVPTL